MPMHVPHTIASDVQAEAAALREPGMVDEAKSTLKGCCSGLEKEDEKDGEERTSDPDACTICRSNKPHIANCERCSGKLCVE